MRQGVLRPFIQQSNVALEGRVFCSQGEHQKALTNTIIITARAVESRKEDFVPYALERFAV